MGQGSTCKTCNLQYHSEQDGGFAAGRVPDPDHGLGVDVGPVGRLRLLRLGVLVHLELALVQVGRRGLLADGALQLKIGEQ